MHRGITVVIPSIPIRADLLERAIRSVERQTLQPWDVYVSVDHDRKGAARTRQHLLEQVETEWVAFLDDDDEMLPGHLEALAGAQQYRDADYVFSWYEVIGGTDPMSGNFGKPWDKENPTQTTITTLVRTEMALEVGGFLGKPDTPTPDGNRAGEDWLFTLRCNEAGRIYHLPVVTWLWHHHGRNTSGMPKW